jgi:hypothetical protein
MGWLLDVVARQDDSDALKTSALYESSYRVMYAQIGRTGVRLRPQILLGSGCCCDECCGSNVDCRT